MSTQALTKHMKILYGTGDLSSSMPLAIVAILFAYKYPITRQTHQDMLNQLAKNP